MAARILASFSLHENVVVRRQLDQIDRIIELRVTQDESATVELVDRLHGQHCALRVRVADFAHRISGIDPGLTEMLRHRISWALAPKQERIGVMATTAVNLGVEDAVTNTAWTAAAASGKGH